MAPREIFITQFDKDRLAELIDVAEGFGAHDRRDLKALKDELDRATVVSSQDVPPEVVTMNSRVLLRDTDTSEERTVTVVFPKDADLAAGSISVLAPVGTAVLGYREGALVEWPVPSGTKRFRIEKILYQPEAAGDLDL